MYCAKCGKEIWEDAKFCANCGHPVVGEIENYEVTGVDSTCITESTEKSLDKSVVTEEKVNDENEVNVFTDGKDYDDKATHAKILSFSGLFSFRGRRGRLPYFLVSLGVSVFIAVYLTVLPDIVLGFDSKLVLLLTLPVIPIWITAYCNTSKRLHDMNLSSNWFWFILFLSRLFSHIPGIVGGFLSLAVILSLALTKGTDGPNKYGPKV